jgi:hypothetical protein
VGSRERAPPARCGRGPGALVGGLAAAFSAVCCTGSIAYTLLGAGGVLTAARLAPWPGRSHPGPCHEKAARRATVPDPRAAHYWDGTGYTSGPDSNGAWLNGHAFAAHVRTALKAEHPRS